MNPETTIPLLLALIAQSGLLAAGWMQRRKSHQEREAAAVDILQDVNGELRTELTRMAADREANILRVQADLDRVRQEADDLRAQLRLARDEARGAHETAGRAMRRVEYLEQVLRRNSIAFEPGPLA